MSFVSFTKKHLTKLPFPVGAALAKVPYSYRPAVGAVYRKTARDIEFLEHASEEVIRNFIFKRVRAVADHAYRNVPFYKQFYKAHNVNPARFQKFDDLQELPIITKSDLQSVELEERSFASSSRILANTGGSSGIPLEFYVEPSFVGHEWAHVHRVWSKVGYKPSCLKIAIGGRADVSGVLNYDAARHHISVNIYLDWGTIADALLVELKKRTARYIHAYPSATFDFVSWLEDQNHPLLNTLRNQVDGLLLVSEYPSPIPRQHAESLLQCRSVAFYGHTERSVMAYERRSADCYDVLHSYGYAEALPSPDGHRLLATGYYGFASPLIRYDTGDFIMPQHSADRRLLHSFEISNGRSGEFILDRENNKVFLTALIFGRHHELFNYSAQLQVFQPEPGKAVILWKPRDVKLPCDPADLFDASNVKVRFDFRVVQDAVKTMTGKTPLLIKQLPPGGE